jgi:group I intron endonuclease
MFLFFLPCGIIERATTGVVIPPSLLTHPAYWEQGMPAYESSTLPRAGIYAIRHIVSGKMYVGSAIDISERWREHRKSLVKGCHHSRYLQRAWNKHGPAAFVFEVLEAVADPTDLIRVEQEYIDQFRSSLRTHGYNVSPTAGSQLGLRHSTETRAKISAAKSNPSSETRAKLAAVQKGRKSSPEHRAKISAAMRGRKWSPEAIAQRVAARQYRNVSPETRAKISAAASNPSAETRAKMSAAAKARRHTPESRAKISAAMRGRKMSPEAIAKSVAGKKSQACRRRVAREQQLFEFRDE